jgi:hypothetical protein
LFKFVISLAVERLLRLIFVLRRLSRVKTGRLFVWKIKLINIQFLSGGSKFEV